jgi:hypothetical protein
MPKPLSHHYQRQWTSTYNELDEKGYCTTTERAALPADEKVQRVAATLPEVEKRGDTDLSDVKKKSKIVSKMGRDWCSC